MLKAKKILIVEDDAIVYKKMQMALKNHEFVTYPYTPSVDEAWQIIQQKPPDLVLIDIDLQGIKRGTDLGFMLSSQYSIPFIYVTKFEDEALFDLALETQHEQYLIKKYIEEIHMVETKPILNTTVLLRSIKTVLKKYENKPSTQREAIMLKTDYAANTKEKTFGTLQEVPVRFTDIALITTNAQLSTSNKNTVHKLKANYIRFETTHKESYYLLSSLKMIMRVLPNSFVRVSEDYVININHPNFSGKVNEAHILINNETIKISSGYKKSFNLKRKEFFG